LRILITNDDGVHAEGLKVLKAIADTLSDDVWTVAPEYEQSGASRALTLADPLRVREVGPRSFAVSGTPTDCVMLGVRDLVQGRRPDLVLSGVNRGQNVAEDVTMSGTVAGAIEGMALGIPAIALSQALIRFEDRIEAHWETALAYGPALVARLLEVGWPEHVILNVNFPARPPQDILAVEVTRQGARDVHSRTVERRTDTRGRPYWWVGFEVGPMTPAQGADLTAMAEGRISVTPLHIDMTHLETLARLEGLIGGAPPGPKARP
jgi:5'-nucleotidase